MSIWPSKVGKRDKRKDKKEELKDLKGNTTEEIKDPDPDKEVPKEQEVAEGETD